MRFVRSADFGIENGGITSPRLAAPRQRSFRLAAGGTGDSHCWSPWCGGTCIEACSPDARLRIPFESVSWGGGQRAGDVRNYGIATT